MLRKVLRVLRLKHTTSVKYNRNIEPYNNDETCSDTIDKIKTSRARCEYTEKENNLIRNHLRNYICRKKNDSYMPLIKEDVLEDVRSIPELAEILERRKI